MTAPGWGRFPHLPPTTDGIEQPSTHCSLVGSLPHACYPALPRPPIPPPLPSCPPSARPAHLGPVRGRLVAASLPPSLPLPCPPPLPFALVEHHRIQPTAPSMEDLSQPTACRHLPRLRLRARVCEPRPWSPPLLFLFRPAGPPTEILRPALLWLPRPATFGLLRSGQYRP